MQRVGERKTDKEMGEVILMAYLWVLRFQWNEKMHKEKMKSGKEIANHIHTSTKMIFCHGFENTG